MVSSTISFKPILTRSPALFAIGFVLHKKTIPLTYIFSALIGMMLIWTSPKSALVFVGLSFPFMTLSTQAIGDTVTRVLKNGKPNVVRWCGLSRDTLSCHSRCSHRIACHQPTLCPNSKCITFWPKRRKNIYSSHLIAYSLTKISNATDYFTTRRWRVSYLPI